MNMWVEYKNKGAKLRKARKNKENQYKKKCEMEQIKAGKTDSNFPMMKKFLKKYNLTPEKYAELLNAQKGVCAICGGVNKKDGNLNIDHDHETGRVRGLLCHNCNSGLGMMKDDPEIMTKATQYIKIHKNRAKIKKMG